MKKTKLYTKTSKGKINFWEIWTKGSTVHTCWGDIAGKPITDSYEAKGKNIGKANETSPAEQAVLEAQSKIDAKLRVKYFDSIKKAKTKLNIKPMLAYSLDAKRAEKLEWPVTVQPKLNGVRCLAYELPDGSVRLMSRGGKDYNLPHIQYALKGKIPKGFALDGEIYDHGVSLQTIRHRMATHCVETVLLKLHCYDYTEIPPNGMIWEDREDGLEAFFSKNRKITEAVLVRGWHCENIEDVHKVHEKYVKDGYEGLILRTHGGLYKLGARSKDLLKLKSFKDAEFRVVGWKRGKDDVPTFRCIQEEGLEFEARPVGTREERAVLMEKADEMIGQLLTVKYQDRSDDNIPIFPVGISFRPPEDL